MKEKFIRQQKGQSLVEMALMLPILLILLAGVVEVSYLIITQNRISNASRAATGFASGNISDWENADHWSKAIGDVAINSVRDTMDLSPDMWDIWAIKAKLNDSGTDFLEWEAVHVDSLGNNTVVSSSEWSGTEEAAVKAQILEQLQQRGTEANDLELVATATYFGSDSLIGMPAVLQPDRLQSLNVMRLDGPAPYQGCDAFPIAVNFESYSLFPPGAPLPPGADYENYPTAGWSHWAGQGDGLPQPTYNDFPRNVPGIHLLNARSGYVYKVKDDSGASGNFNWLSWNGCQSAGCIEDSLIYPGNSDQYSGMGDLNGNGRIDRFDLVEGSSGNVASAWDLFADQLFAQTGRTVKFLVFTPATMSIDGNPPGDANDDGWATAKYGGDNWFEVYSYIVTRVHGGNKSQGGGGGFLIIEYIGWATDCGGLGER